LKFIQKTTINRRQLLQGAAATLPLLHTSLRASAPAANKIDVDLHRQPDIIRVFLGDETDTLQPLQQNGSRWSAAGVELACTLADQRTGLTLHAPGIPIRRLHLRWHARLSENLLILGDAWERSYGDLAWLPMQPERVLPWYCLLHDGPSTFGIGVATNPNALAFWQIDPEGVSLWLDVRNGGSGVLLADRQLPLASIVTCHSDSGENAFQTTRKLCTRMAAGIDIPKRRGSHNLSTIYGSNDWYYAYGKNTAEGLLRDADLVRELAPSGPVRPFTVIDDGYQDRARFPDLGRLSEDIRRREVTPGIWVRPTQASTATPTAWLLPATRYGRRQDRAADLAYDPTIPEARAAVLKVVQQACTWNYDLIKHDFTTYELLGQWGNEMGPTPTVDGWHFHDRSQTNAEIIASLYRDIRAAAGSDRIVLGCNTIGHLSVGLFDATRSGDDVSGRVWERTRRCGVNTLAFRLPQDGVFFSTDADCVPITHDIPWNLTEQWLRAVAASGTVLLISPEPGAIGPEQKRAISAAFAQSASAYPTPQPTDWLRTRTPEAWTGNRYNWLSPEGASPFSI
jgi:alpha-galactosidase